MLIISVLGIYPIPVYRGACPIVRRCGLSSDIYAVHSLPLWVSRLLERPSLTSKALAVFISAKVATVIESVTYGPYGGKYGPTR